MKVENLCPIDIVKQEIIRSNGNTPQLHVEFKNNSQNVLTGVILHIVCYNKDGKKIKDTEENKSFIISNVVLPNVTNEQSFVVLHPIFLLPGTERIDIKIIQAVFEEDEDWDITAPKKKKLRKIAIISSVIAIIAIITAIAVSFITTSIENERNWSLNYTQAISLLKEGKVNNSLLSFQALGKYKKAKDFAIALTNTNVIDNNKNIYYSDKDDQYNLYCLSLDGNIKKLNSDRCYNLTLGNGVIYYTDNNNLDNIFKINTDGNGRAKLTDDKGQYLAVSGNFVFYSSVSDENRMYRINLDGSARTKINDDFSTNITSFNNQIYYINRSDMGKIYRVNTDGSGHKLIVDDPSKFIYISGYRMYYTNEREGNRIYSANLEGGDKVRLNSEASKPLYELDGWLYFYNLNDDQYYKMKLNGTQKELIK